MPQVRIYCLQFGVATQGLQQVTTHCHQCGGAVSGHIKSAKQLLPRRFEGVCDGVEVFVAGLLSIFIGSGENGVVIDAKFLQ